MRSRRIKVVQFVTSFDVGGTERQVVNLARALDTAQFELRLACLRRRGAFLDEIEATGIPVTEYRAQSLYKYKSMTERLRFARDVRRDRVDIIHAFNFYPNVFAIPAAWLARTPVVIASVRLTEGVLTPIERRAQKLSCALADCIVANAEAVRQWLIADGCDPKKIVVIRNGVDLTRFADGNGRGALRRAFGVPPRAPLVAMVSRLVRAKGVDVFLDGAAIVAGRFPEARFLIVGDELPGAGEGYRSALERRAGELGIGKRVVFTGYRRDTPEVLSEMSVSVLPSFSEGLPNVVLESMAAGVPVVATRVGGTAELVEDGVTGFLVPPGDAAALARAICLLLANSELASRFGEAGRERVATEFSVTHLARETERLYLNLMGHLGRCPDTDELRLGAPDPVGGARPAGRPL